MIDQVTKYLNLPLPHPENALNGDVLRLRDALFALDEAIGRIKDILKTDNGSLNSFEKMEKVIGQMAKASDLEEMNALILKIKTDYLIGMYI